MDDLILWTDWRTQQIADFSEYVELLTTFVRSRFVDGEVAVHAEYQGPGSYRLKYWYNRPKGQPPLVKLDWEGV